MYYGPERARARPAAHGDAEDGHGIANGSARGSAGAATGAAAVLSLLERGQYQTFALLLFSIVVSLTCHEYAHAATAKRFGDRTAEQRGRLTLNPLAHMDPIGLAMIVLIGFGWARPVPVTTRFLTSRWAPALIAAAGPLVNLALAFLAVNAGALAASAGVEFASSPGARAFLGPFVTINLALFLFNLIPLGPLDGHWILPHLLSTKLARAYVAFNDAYGSLALLGLLMLSFAGVDVFGPLWDAARWLREALTLF